MRTRRFMVAAVAASSLVLASCSQAEESADNAEQTAADSTAAADSQELIIEDNFGEKTVQLPAQRVAVTDNRAFEQLADWDVPVVAAPLNLVPDTLSDKLNEDTVEFNMGNHREPDLEALVAAEPDLVINGQRFAQYQEDIEGLVEDVPVLDFTPREDKDMAEELIRQTEAMGQLFDREEEAQQEIDDFNEALERAKNAYEPGKKVMAVNTSGGEINYIAPGKGRFFGPFFDMLGLEPALEVADGTDDHEGDDISVEAIANSNPDWIFIMDRDGAVANDEEGYVPGQQLVEDSAALQNVTAVKDGNIVAAPADTYTNENIITYTETLNAIADAFEAQ
ncbi:ABC-type enterochelin transport system, periplasmic component [Corynebacterium camporealensis]|uniref:ABC-type enterochelin transport system, periplasmic component n=1 Tax=Corynebacterium camporealensis TaxID=161896 RepID=A0A0F6QV72_9CORY|nr:ABC transporter substrate-binding protein [Corynebacterium camporealensis]AKE38667.1 ABC-type enterochelin transport system, periplasmic component [Corynebacterium camporealensis]AVH87951.1 ABC-type enterochelin transport system, periplasmic component [Corynebacterium camporealensis]